MTFASYIRRERMRSCVNFWRENFLALLVAVATGNIHMKTNQEQK